MTLTSIILAGGKSLRLGGRDKAFELVGGRNLLQGVIDRLAPLSRQIIVVISAGKPLPGFLSPVETKIVTDIYPHRGTLGGLFTGLTHSESFHNLVVACDMPFLNPMLLRYLISLAPDFDVVVPRVQGLLEPLHAVYSKNCLTLIEKMLRGGKLMVIEFYPQVGVRYVEEEEYDQFDLEHLSFFNINTGADLERARELAEKILTKEPHQ